MKLFGATVVAWHLLAAGSLASAETLICPAPEKVTLSASSPGWWDPSKQTAASPRASFDSVAFNAPNLVVCRYRVGGTGVVRLHKAATCVPAKGKWREQDGSRVCAAGASAACTLECKR